MHGIEKKRQIKSYNAFRGICALGILFSHMSYLSDASNPFWATFYDHFMKYGSRCTSFFFIMSGFLLAYTWKELPFNKYIKGKLKRIYPLTLFVFILAVGCSFILNDTVNEGVAIGSTQWIINAVLNITMLKAFVPVESVFYSFHGPSWYISVLFIFYIVGYFIVKSLKNKNSNICDKRNSNRKALLFISVVCAIAYLIQLAVCLVVDINALSDCQLYLTYINPYFRIFGEGLLGILLCEYMPAIREKISNLNKSILEIVAFLAFIGFFLVNNFIHSSVWSAWIWFVPVSLIIIAYNEDAGIVSKIAKGRFWQFLGNVSFELYMTHAFVYEGLPVIAGVVSTELKGWLIYHAGTRFLITLVASVIFAWVVHLILNIGKLKKKQRVN
ncbi:MULTISPECIES: acyltransferase [unclassified Ruminococcus]|uniref:acyltransferase family protein n=1 Tax=unclassified Ruminococcus TaxID=2608920 RepID=UPI00210BC955|nr:MULTISPECIES: acyltransferase [unclassified Ruminococcus]MCQ4022559.1 acyltransferase family protein [Ruminococcus sp. zg-924]MCQ4114799.1 acyltransferase family protein [Ruminococcus sp. zg-921]